MPPVAAAVDIAGQHPGCPLRENGRLPPLISEKTALGERRSRETGSIWLCWFGLHCILTFFGLLSTLVWAILLYQGFRMMTADLSKSRERVRH